MKKAKYENPEMDLLVFEQNTEIIVTSNLEEGDGETSSPFSLPY